LFMKHVKKEVNHKQHTVLREASSIATIQYID